MAREHVVCVFFPRWRDGRVAWFGVDAVRQSIEPPDILLVAWEIERRRRILEELEASPSL